MKYGWEKYEEMTDEGRSPQGERGLKLMESLNNFRKLPSLPARGAWIEIILSRTKRTSKPSLPARGAWIEIENVLIYCDPPYMVAPRKGSVD